jgi:hypothetical protein
MVRTVSKECRRQCRHWSYDMDSEYCAHPKAMDVSWAGVNLNRMLGAPQYKPPDGVNDPAWNACEGHKLWEPVKS